MQKIIDRVSKGQQQNSETSTYSGGGLIIENWYASKNQTEHEQKREAEIQTTNYKNENEKCSFRPGNGNDSLYDMTPSSGI